MTLTIPIIILAAILLPALLYFETRENRKGLIPTKTCLSLLFIVAAVAQPHPDSVYYYPILLTGLIFCLGGDLFLALPQQKMFLPGLISFLVGHIFYVIAFFNLSSLNSGTLMGAILFILISGGVYIWLMPHLGSMKRSVLAYVVVITLMVSGASTVLVDSAQPLIARHLVFFGALLFYGSDVFVARDRFIKKASLNRIAGLPLYYTGQFLLAFSIGFVH